MCQYNDCGWCYAKDSVINNSSNGQCNKPKECPQSIQAKPDDKLSITVVNV